MEPLVAKKVQYLSNRLDQAAAIGETLDIRQWLNYFTFDIISDMTFGNDPGMLKSGKGTIIAETSHGKLYPVNPIRSFQNSTIHVASLGHWPELFHLTKPLTRWWPNSKCGDDLEAICIQQIRQRLQKPKKRMLQHNSHSVTFFSIFWSTRSATTVACLLENSSRKPRCYFVLAATPQHPP